MCRQRSVTNCSILSYSQFCLVLKCRVYGMDIQIAAVYIPPDSRGRNYSDDFHAVLNQLEHASSQGPLLVCGDMNARIGKFAAPIDQDEITPQWFLRNRCSQDKVVNSRGRLLLQFLAENSLSVLNGTTPKDISGHYTFLSQNGCSVLDLAIINNAFMHSPKIASADLAVTDTPGSAHLPLSVTLEIFSTATNTSPDSRMVSFWNDESKDDYSRALEDQLNPNPTSPEAFITAVQNAAKATNLIRHTTRRCNAPKQAWYDQQCRDAKRLLKQSLRRFKYNSCTANAGNYRRELTNYKRLLDEKKRLYYAAIRAEFEVSRSSQTFWSCANKFRKRGNVQSVCPIDDETLYLHFAELFHNDDTSDLDQPTPQLSDPQLDAPVTLQEVTDVLRLLPGDKSPGCDAIRNEFLKFLPDSAIPVLTNIINYMYSASICPSSLVTGTIVPVFKKGIASEIANYRPITLLPVLLKVVTSVLCKRLNTKLSAENLICENQAGFRKRYGCSDHIFTLHCLIEHRLCKPRQKLYALFIDLKSAFDSVNHSVLWNRLRDYKCSSTFLSFLKVMYRNARARVRTLTGNTDCFNIGKGVLQGEILSPALFSLFINDIVSELLEKSSDGVLILDTLIQILLFADDMVVLATSPLGLQQHIRVLEAYFARMKLKVNLTKTKIIVFRRGGRLASNEKWSWNGSNIEVVNQYVYLGVPFNTKGSFAAAANHFTTKSFKALDVVITLIRSSGLNSFKNALKLFEALVTSVTLYASEIWCFNFIEAMDRVFGTFMRKLFMLSRFTAGYSIRLETGYYALRRQILKRIFSYWIKVLEMADDRFPLKCYKMMTNNPEIMQGTRVNWIVYVKRTLDNLGYSFVWNSQDPAIVKTHLPAILQTATDQQKSYDLGRLRISPRYTELALIKKDSLTEPYIDANIKAEERQLLFKLRIQLDSLYHRGEVTHFEILRTCPICLGGLDTLRHLLASCSLCDASRTPEIQIIVDQFYASSGFNCPAKLQKLCFFASRCLELKRNVG
jgi:hypothetical protein